MVFKKIPKCYEIFPLFMLLLGSRPLKRPRHRWKDIRKDLWYVYIGCEDGN
jgi:hypothetical protein